MIKVHKRISTSNYDFCIIINNAFSVRYLIHLIRSLVQQRKISPLLVIIDYNSAEVDLITLAKILERYNKEYIIVHQIHNDIGSTNQRNIGWFIVKKYFKCEYIMFLDSDIVFYDNYLLYKLYNIVKRLREFPGFSHVLYNLDGTVQWSGAKMLGPLILEMKTYTVLTDFLHGAFMVVKSDIANDQMIFPKIFFIGFDDYYISLALRRKYKNINYIVLSISKVFHIGGGTSSRCSKTRLYEGTKNLVWMSLKYNNLMTSIISFIEYFIYNIYRCLKQSQFNIIGQLSTMIRGLSVAIKLRTYAN